MTIHADPVAIKAASKAIENLFRIIACLKFAVCTRGASPTNGCSPREVGQALQAAVSEFAKQLRNQLAIAKEGQTGNAAACIRAVAHRRPVSAHDMVWETAVKIDAVIHVLWPELHAARVSKSKQKSSNFFAKIAPLLSSMDGIAMGELLADRDRAIACAGDKSVAFSTDQKRLEFFNAKKDSNPTITHDEVARLWCEENKDICDGSSMKQSVYRARRANKRVT